MSRRANITASNRPAPLRPTNNNNDYRQRESTTSHIPCRFFNTPTGCYKGKYCRFSHDMNSQSTSSGPAASSSAMTDGQSATSSTASNTAAVDGEQHTCGICLETPKTFGLLINCQHVFCLDCIRIWRSNDRKTEETLDTRMHKTCPECRKHSDYIVPSATYYRHDTPEKQAQIERHLAALSKIPCKHFTNSPSHSRFCPFGNECHYAHKVDGYPYTFDVAQLQRMKEARERRQFRRQAEGLFERLMEHEREFGENDNDGFVIGVLQSLMAGRDFSGPNAFEAFTRELDLFEIGDDRNPFGGYFPYDEDEDDDYVEDEDEDDEDDDDEFDEDEEDEEDDLDDMPDLVDDEDEAGSDDLPDLIDDVDDLPDLIDEEDDLPDLIDEEDDLPDLIDDEPEQRHNRPPPQVYDMSPFPDLHDVFTNLFAEEQNPVLSNSPGLVFNPSSRPPTPHPTTDDRGLSIQPPPIDVARDGVYAPQRSPPILQFHPDYIIRSSFATLPISRTPSNRPLFPLNPSSSLRNSFGFAPTSTARSSTLPSSRRGFAPPQHTPPPGDRRPRPLRSTRNRDNRASHWNSRAAPAPPPAEDELDWEDESGSSDDEPVRRTNKRDGEAKPDEGQEERGINGRNWDSRATDLSYFS